MKSLFDDLATALLVAAFALASASTMVLLASTNV
jgi:hypothetical protein